MRAARLAKSKPAKPALRRRAEELLRNDRPKNRRAVTSSGEYHRLVHELRVHQVELDLQNEELRRAYHALEASYNELYDFAPVGYLTFDNRGVIRKANLTMAAMLVSERQELIGNRLTQLVDAASREALQLCIRRSCDEGGKQVCMLTLRTTSNVPVYTVMEAAPFEGYYRAVIVDITSIRQEQVARRDSDARLKLAVDALKIGVWEWERASQKMFLTTECSEIFGLAALVIDLAVLKTLVHRDDWPQFSALLEGSGTANRPRSLEYRIVKPDGEIAWVHSLGSVQHDIEGRPSGIVGTAKDITARRRSEKDLRQALEEKDELQSTVVRLMQDLSKHPAQGEMSRKRQHARRPH